MEDTTNEEVKTTGTVPEFLIDKATLYHGSRASGIENIFPAEETTIGRGVYLTSDIQAAEGYARRRSNSPETKPTTYQVEVENLRLADLREKLGVDVFADKLLQRLEDELKRNPDWPPYQQEAARRTIEKTRNHSYKSLKDITWNHQGIVTAVIQSDGFDGLVALEGGEGEEIGEHDSYVVFDPSKIKTIQEIKPIP